MFKRVNKNPKKHKAGDNYTIDELCGEEEK